MKKGVKTEEVKEQQTDRKIDGVKRKEEKDRQAGRQMKTDNN